MSDASFPKHRRLLKSTEFDKVFAARNTVRGKSIRVHGRLNGRDSSRLGLVVSRRVGNAVRRNRWKRLIREAFRHAHVSLPIGLDLVVIPAAAQPEPLTDLRRELIHLAKRIQTRIDEDIP